MPAQRTKLDEGFDSSSPTSDLRGIVSASPAVTSLLPYLMRNLADEIESASYTGPLPPSATSLRQPVTAVNAELVVRQVATDLSARLRRHLALGAGAHATDRATEDGSKQPAHAPTEELASCTDGTSPTRPRLRLKLLGTPEITLDGARLKVLERCGRASLIIYTLALHPRGLSGERLAAYIASDSVDVDAFDTGASTKLGAVRTFVWRLRKLTGWRDIVVSEGEQGGYHNRYKLPDDAICDLWEFEANLDEAARLAVRANVEPDAADQAAALRQDAILSYGGEFCKGIGAGSISQAAEYLRHRYLQAVLLQATYWKHKAISLREARHQSGIAGGPPVQEERAWLEALSNYRLAAQVEPYDESAYVGAMLCQAHLGQTKGVQKTLALCSRVLNAELDRSPLPATIRTARECLQIASNVSYTQVT